MLCLATALGTVAIACTATAPPGTPAGETAVPLVPLPVSTVAGTGFWTPSLTLLVSTSDRTDDELRALAAVAVDALRGTVGSAASVTGADDDRRGAVHLLIDPGYGSGSPEAYRLTIDTNGVEVRARAGAGLFYGIQTLRQLLLAAAPDAASRAGRPVAVPAVTIDDAPRFGYRGMLLDVGRHFQPVDVVKRFIDVMARYKFNRFHWHLTEDQGWRIEITQYPRLTEVASCRDETQVGKNRDPFVGDGIRHCGFYTQEEIRDVVAYAAARYVTIVPEVEMPGHSRAAIAAYPELGCTGSPVTVRTMWGIDPNIYCPSEETFTFLENVLTEVMALFPGEYIHIGGDEAPKEQWEQSELAQAVIAREGLADEHELQSWFVRRIEQFLNANGRRLIGWDEILEGGLAPRATVMSWRGEDGGIAAARQGHDVIMSPNTYLYLDYYQADPANEPLTIGGDLPLETVYGYEPIPAALTEDEARHIIGVQGNVWAEYLKTPAGIDYMAYPRALALAEITWSPAEVRNWDDFRARLPHALRQLDRLGVNYRPID